MEVLSQREAATSPACSWGLIRRGDVLVCQVVLLSQGHLSASDVLWRFSYSYSCYPKAYRLHVLSTVGDVTGRVEIDVARCVLEDYGIPTCYKPYSTLAAGMGFSSSVQVL